MSDTGILSFALGLQSAGFVGSLGQASGALKGFVASALGFTSVYEGITAAIEKGADLSRLSRRTGESVAELYTLQKGFKAAGLSAEDVGPALFKMEKSLGGVNEMGERTDDIFRRLGLNIRDLRKEDGAAAMDSIVKSLGRLNQSGAASAASSIFGREGAANIIQLSRSSELFADGLAKAASGAQLFQRDSEIFNRLSVTLDELKGKGLAFFAGIAEAAAPAAQKIADYFNSIDFSGLGQSVGRYITAFTEAFSSGNVTELITTSLTSGFQAFLDVLPAMVEEMSLIIRHALLPGGTKGAFQGFLKWGYSMGADDPQQSPEGKAYLEKVMGNIDAKQVETFKAENEQIAASRRLADEDLRKGLIQASKDIQPVKDLINGLIGKAMHDGRPSRSLTNATADDLSPGVQYHQAFTALEKMSFVMSGLNNPLMNDSARQTAQNTLRLNSQMQTLIDRMNRFMNATGNDLSRSNVLA